MDYIRNRNRPRVLSLIAVAVLLLLGIITLGLAKTASFNAHEKTVEKFRWDTEQISDRIQSTLNSYSGILYSGRALVLSSHNVEPSEWSGFFKNQDVFNQHQGMSAVSYFQLVPAAQKASFEAYFESN